MKSTDRKLSLLHFIADTVADKFPELTSFDSELQYIDKAALGL
jgi:hypothetical protein